MESNLLFSVLWPLSFFPFFSGLFLRKFLSSNHDCLFNCMTSTGWVPYPYNEKGHSLSPHVSHGTFYMGHGTQPRASHHSRSEVLNRALMKQGSDSKCTSQAAHSLSSQKR